MNRSIAAVVYAARRSQVGGGTGEIVVPIEGATDGATATLTMVPFEELTSEQKEPLFAEVREYLQSGTPMFDALGQAITDALK